MFLRDWCLKYSVKKRKTHDRKFGPGILRPKQIDEILHDYSRKEYTRKIKGYSRICFMWKDYWNSYTLNNINAYNVI